MNLQITHYKNYHWYDNFIYCFKAPNNRIEERIGELFLEFFPVFDLHAFSFEISNPYNWHKHSLKIIKEGQITKKEFLICTSELFTGGQKAVFPCLKISKSWGFKKFVCLADISLEFFSEDKLKKLKLHELAAQSGIAPKIYYSNDTTQKCWTRFTHYGDLVSYISFLGPMNCEILCKITLQLIHLVRKLHDMGIAHRDIKPDNILVDIDEKSGFKLLLNDFGFSTQDPMVYDRVGTSQYEAIESSYYRGIDPKIADLYSLGLTLFTLYTNKDLANLLKVHHKNQLLLSLKGDKPLLGKQSKKRIDDLRLDILFLIETHFKLSSLTLKRILTTLLEPNPQKRSSLQAILDIIEIDNG
jgi:serine/threonine protein kinase